MSLQLSGSSGMTINNDFEVTQITPGGQAEKAGEFVNVVHAAVILVACCLTGHVCV